MIPPTWKNHSLPEPVTTVRPAHSGRNAGLGPLRSGYALPPRPQTCVLILIDAGFSPCLSRGKRHPPPVLFVLFVLIPPPRIAQIARLARRQRLNCSLTPRRRKPLRARSPKPSLMARPSGAAQKPGRAASFRSKNGAGFRHGINAAPTGGCSVASAEFGLRRAAMPAAWRAARSAVTHDRRFARARP